MKRFLIPFSIILGGFALAALLIVTGPKLKARATLPNAPLVRAIEVVPQTVHLSTSTHGTVTPRTESELVPEVSGRIVAMSSAMVSGGFFNKGDLLVTIDPLDYEVALEQARAVLARAQSGLAIARRTHIRQKNLARKQSTSEAQMDDALNRLRSSEATLREATAKLARADRDIERTQMIAPYDGRVRSERIDVGQFVNRGAAIAMIYATDIAEVKLPIHDEELAFLDLPLTASNNKETKRLKVTLGARFAGKEHEWQGEVVRTEGELDPRTRMINIIAQVKSPYNQREGKPPLAVGLFVNAKIHGRTVKNVVTIPRIGLRGESLVYIIDSENRLRFQTVEVLRIAQDKVFITSGLTKGDKVCVSPLDSAVNGMAVKLHKTGNIELDVKS